VHTDAIAHDHPTVRHGVERFLGDRALAHQHGIRTCHRLDDGSGIAMAGTLDHLKTEGPKNFFLDRVLVVASIHNDGDRRPAALAVANGIGSNHLPASSMAVRRSFTSSAPTCSSR